MIEPLERRVLCTAQHNRPTFNVSNGTLAISGSRYDDVIEVHRTGPDARSALKVKLNRRTYVVHDRVRRAVIYGGGGNDSVTFGAMEDGYEDFYDIGMSAYIDGGTGNDTIQSGIRADTLFGGTGNDALDGVYVHDAGDYMDGGPGDDVLYGGQTMYGGPGHDVAEANGVIDPLVSGLESLILDDEGEGTGPTVIAREDWRSDLYTQGDTLVFNYHTPANWAITIDGPIDLPDGRLGLRIHEAFLGAPRDTAPPAGTIRKTFDLAEAQRRGIVLYSAKDSQFHEGQLTVLATPW